MTRSSRRSRSASSARSIGYGTVETRRPDPGGLGQELLPVVPGVGGHAPQGPLLEQVPLVVEGGDVAQVDAGDGQRPTPVQGGQRGRDEGADRGEQDGGVQRLGRRGIGVPRAGGTELEGQLLGLP